LRQYGLQHPPVAGTGTGLSPVLRLDLYSKLIRTSVVVIIALWDKVTNDTLPDVKEIHKTLTNVSRIMGEFAAEVQQIGKKFTNYSDEHACFG